MAGDWLLTYERNLVDDADMPQAGPVNRVSAMGDLDKKLYLEQWATLRPGLVFAEASSNPLQSFPQRTRAGFGRPTQNRRPG